MRQLMSDVRQIVDQEYDRASKKFGEFNHTDHESYAIIKEELEEGQEEINYLTDELHEFWELVKHDFRDVDKLSCLAVIQSRSILAACELIQVAAMAHKASLTIKNRIGDSNDTDQ